MSNQTAILESFLADESNFIVKLRFLDGLDKENVEVFIKILKGIKNEIKAKDMIEKRLAFLLVEIVPILMSLTSMYSEKEQEEILSEIDRISMTISEVLEP